MTGSGLNGLVGVVLAGGGSTRMGRDKATILRRNGETLVARAVRVLRGVASTVVVADRGRGVAKGIPTVEDAPFAGPAGALLGAAEQFPRCLLLVLACDLPRVPGPLLAFLAGDHPEADLVLPCHGQRPQLEPLCARWGPRALTVLRSESEAGRLALHPIAQRADLRVKRIGDAKLRRFGDPATMLLNVNTEADLSAAGLV